MRSRLPCRKVKIRQQPAGAAGISSLILEVQSFCHDSRCSRECSKWNPALLVTEMSILLRNSGGWGWSSLGAKYDQHIFEDASAFTGSCRNDDEVQHVQQALILVLGCDTTVVCLRKRLSIRCTLKNARCPDGDPWLVEHDVALTMEKIRCWRRVLDGRTEYEILLGRYQGRSYTQKL